MAKSIFTLSLGGDNGQVMTNRESNVGSISDETIGSIDIFKQSIDLYKIAQSQVMPIFGASSLPFDIMNDFYMVVPVTALTDKSSGLWDTYKGADFAKLKQISEYFQITHSRGYKANWDARVMRYSQDPTAVDRITNFVKQFDIVESIDQMFFAEATYYTQKARDYNLRKMNLDLNLSNKYNIRELIAAQPIFMPLNPLQAGLSIPNYGLASTIEDLGNAAIVAGSTNIVKRTSIGTAISFDKAQAKSISIEALTVALPQLVFSKYKKVINAGKNAEIFITPELFYNLETNTKNDSIQKVFFLNNGFTGNKQTSLAWELTPGEMAPVSGGTSIEGINGFNIRQFIVDRNCAGYFMSPSDDSSNIIGGQIEPTANLSAFIALENDGVSLYPSETTIMVVPSSVNPTNNLVTMKATFLSTLIVTMFGASNLLPIVESNKAIANEFPFISMAKDAGDTVDLKKSDLVSNKDQSLFINSKDAIIGSNITAGVGTGFWALESLPADEGYMQSKNSSSDSNLAGVPIRSQLLLPNGKTIADVTGYPYANSLAKAAADKAVILPTAATSSVAMKLKANADNKNPNIQLRLVKYNSLTDSIPSALITNSVMK